MAPSREETGKRQPRRTKTPVTVKSTTTIRIDSALLLKAKELGLNVSAASAEGIEAAARRATARKR